MKKNIPMNTQNLTDHIRHDRFYPQPVQGSPKNHQAPCSGKRKYELYDTPDVEKKIIFEIVKLIGLMKMENLINE